MSRKIKLPSELILLLLIIAIFIFIRSIHFSLYLNFSHDQGLFSIKALEIYREKIITLIGPAVSIGFQGRQIFQGSVIYYFQLFFLILGSFDPIISSYIFMIFASFMVIPLYYGSKLLINKTAALLIVILYSLFPYYINYTRFLWNPNFQLSLVPLLIFFMGRFKSKKTYFNFFLLAIYSGFLLQFHYQFLVVTIGLLVYYFLISKLTISYFWVYFIGFLAGFSPLIIFDIRNNFYNLSTLLLYLQNSQFLPGINQNSNIAHYFLSISLMLIITITSSIKKVINKSFVLIIFIAFLTLSLILYLPKPSHGFGMADNWNYPDEEKVGKIIQSNQLSNFNIVNLSYDTLSIVQKYMLYKNQGVKKLEDYKNNKYLYVINKDEKFINNPAYEINTFKPFKKIGEWSINPFYTLYLLERTL